VIIARRTWLVCALLLCAGCDRREQDLRRRLQVCEAGQDSLRSELDAARQGAAEAESRLVLAHLQLQTEQQRQAAEVSRLEARSRDLEAALEAARAEASGQSAQLALASQALARARAHIAGLQAAPKSATGEKEARLNDFIHRPLDTEGDLFPIYVHSVFGTLRPAGYGFSYIYPRARIYTPRTVGGTTVWAEGPLPRRAREYDYRVSFSLRNLTRTVKEVAASTDYAGTSVKLGPGESREGIVLQGRPGSTLTVTCGNETRILAVP